LVAGDAPSVNRRAKDAVSAIVTSIRSTSKTEAKKDDTAKETGVSSKATPPSSRTRNRAIPSLAPEPQDNATKKTPRESETARELRAATGGRKETPS